VRGTFLSALVATGVPGSVNHTIDAGFHLPDPPVLTKRVSANRAELGSVVSYTLTLANSTSVASVSTTVTDSFSAGLGFVPGTLVTSVGTSTTSASGFVWYVPSLPASTTATLTFSASLTQEGIVYNTATTPGGQRVQVCTTVPVHVCAGVPFEIELSAPASVSSVQWNVNGQPIPGATSRTLSVTQAGEYTVSGTSGAGCPNGSCCPYVIVEDPLPSLTAVTVSASCVNGTAQPNARITLVGSSTSAASYNITMGSSFTATAPLFGSPQALSAVTNGNLLSGLANPAQATDYTIRVYTATGTSSCYQDYVVQLQPTVCGCPPPKCVPISVTRVR
jgi:uncharacterized repeat protein (TIGR01451 family)